MLRLWFIIFGGILFWLSGAAAQDVYSNQFLVCFQKDVPSFQVSIEKGIVQTGFSSFDKLCREFQVSGMERWLTSAGEEDIDGDIKLANIYRVKMSGTRAVEEAIDAFAKNEWVHSAEYEPINRPDVFINPYTPNDPSLMNQWYIVKIMAEWAWGLWTTFGLTPADTTVVVGVVDSGVEWDHPDLMANIWVNPAEDIDGDGVVGDFGTPANGGDEDGIDNDGNGKVDDLIGWDLVGYDHNLTQQDNNPMATASDHGTNVSGCASGVADNGVGIAGVGFRVKIMPVKCGADDGYPYILHGYDGILYAAKTGADIINCSWGSYGYSGYGQSVINLAHNTYGAIIVASAGNDGLNMNLPGNAHYPSNYNNVICVAGTDSDDGKAAGSNYGSAVDICAPYSSIYTTTFMSNGGYQTTGGTSFSSPIVAGGIALLKSMFPDSGQAWLEDRILQSADNIDAQNPNYIGMLGSGRLNVFKAVGQPLFPSIVYNNQALQILNDDGDGLLNPGEGALLRVVLKNESGWRDVDNLEAVLRCNNPHINIADSTASYGPVSNGSVTINLSDPFEFYVDSLAPTGDYDFTLYVQATSGSQPLYEKYIPVVINVSGYQMGWPVSGLATVQSSPLLADVYATQELEVFTGSNGGDFYGWNYDGTPLTNFPVSLGGQMWGSPAMGDIDNDGNSEIVIGSSTGHLFVLSTDGIIEQDWNIGEFIYGTVSLADLDGNNDLELIFGTFSGNLHVLNHDGSSFGNFPVAFGALDKIISGCSVADINGDGNPEIVAGTQNKNIYAVDVNGNVLAGFPYAAGERFMGSVVTADLDGSGSNGVRIIAGAQDGKLYVLKGDGSVDFVFNTGAAIRGTPGLCDVDGDGKVEIFVGNNNGEVYGLKWNASQLNGFPLTLGGNVESQPVFADLDGNGSPEMIITAMDGKIYGYDFSTGTWANGFPSPIAGQIKSTPTIADIDLDNDLEIAFGTSNSFAILDMKQKNGTVVNHWSTFQANYRRTGYYGDAVSGIGSGNHMGITTYELRQNYPNPFNPVTTISYRLKESGQVDFRVFNILGQEVYRFRGKQSAGEHKLVFDGSRLSSGIYFYRLEAGEFSATRKMVLMK